MTTSLIENRSHADTAAGTLALPQSMPPSMAGSRSGPAKRWIACGLFLLVLGVYALSGAGRIDMVDGQARYDVAYNWLVNGRPILTDKWMSFMSVPGRDGLRYSGYGAAGSVVAMPLVWLGFHVGGADMPTSQFLFSLTSAVCGAGIALILFLFYLELGVPTRKAIGWTLVSSFATYVWPISNSTFDNAQHAFFVLAALYFAYLSSRRKSGALAAVGGLCAATLFNYQEYFLLIIPILGFATLDWQPMENISHIKRLFQTARSMAQSAWNNPGDDRASLTRYALFLAMASVGLILALAYNDLRFGSFFNDGKMLHASYPPIWGNPLTGFLTLLVSPGKGVFLYSPPLLLAIFGIGQLWRRKPELVLLIGASSVALLFFLSCVAFEGGDWCWGPRYLTPLLPLWALTFPFATASRSGRNAAFVLVATGVLVQILALSVENQRFFFERGLNDFFWAEYPWYYFNHSALFARFGEAISLSKGVPATATQFSTIPAWSTHCLLGPPPNVPRAMASVWIRNFKVFFVPRPWPLWMSAVSPMPRPIDVAAWLQVLASMSFVGGALIYLGIRKGECQ